MSEMSGKLKKLKGRGKEAIGVAVGDEELEIEGANERAEGAAEETVGKVRRKAGELVEDIGAAIKK
ncbi:MAG: CsbD family protein [Vicinamibacteria bacterium]